MVCYLFLVSFRFFKRSVFFINEQFVSFFNALQINVSFYSLTERSVNFQKLPFVNGTLHSPNLITQLTKRQINLVNPLNSLVKKFTRRDERTLNKINKMQKVKLKMISFFKDVTWNNWHLCGGTVLSADFVLTGTRYILKIILFNH